MKEHALMGLRQTIVWLIAEGTEEQRLAFARAYVGGLKWFEREDMHLARLFESLIGVCKREHGMELDWNYVEHDNFRFKMVIEDV